MAFKKTRLLCFKLLTNIPLAIRFAHLQEITEHVLYFFNYFLWSIFRLVIEPLPPNSCHVFHKIVRDGGSYRWNRENVATGWVTSAPTTTIGDLIKLLGKFTIVHFKLPCFALIRSSKCSIKTCYDVWTIAPVENKQFRIESPEEMLKYSVWW